MCSGCVRRNSRYNFHLWSQWWVQVCHFFHIFNWLKLNLYLLVIALLVLSSFVLKKDSQFYQRQARFSSHPFFFFFLLLLVPRMLFLYTIFQYLGMGRQEGVLSPCLFCNSCCLCGEVKMCNWRVPYWRRCIPEKIFLIRQSITISKLSLISLKNGPAIRRQMPTD